MIKVIIFFASCVFSSVNAQIVHHQTFASQGKNKLLSSGFVVSQSIAQNSPSGTFKNSNIVVQQGFQQYVMNKYSISNSGISVKVYPNPFVSDLNFEFSHPINEDIQVSLFDLTGKLVQSFYKKSTNQSLSIDFSQAQDGNYIVLLNVGTYKFSTKVIKMNKL